MKKENEILSTDKALWEKVFMASNKETPMIEDGTNYGDFLLKTIESEKDQFTDEEYKKLMGFTVVPMGQGFARMSPPTKELMKLSMIVYGYTWLAIFHC